MIIRWKTTSSESSVLERVTFKLCTLVYKSLHGSAPIKVPSGVVQPGRQRLLSREPPLSRQEQVTIVPRQTVNIRASIIWNYGSNFLEFTSTTSQERWTFLRTVSMCTKIAFISYFLRLYRLKDTLRVCPGVNDILLTYFSVGRIVEQPLNTPGHSLQDKEYNHDRSPGVCYISFHLARVPCKYTGKLKGRF